MYRKSQTVLVVLGLLFIVVLASGCTPPAGEWWFSTVAPAERERQYHIGFAFDSPGLHIEDHGECIVTVIMEPTPDDQGLTWRLVDAGEQCDTSTTLGLWMWWIELMQNAKDRGTGVPDRESRRDRAISGGSRRTGWFRSSLRWRSLPPKGTSLSR